MSGTITCSLKNLAKTLDKELQKEMKQVRFAAMNALNDVAFQKVRPKLEEEYKKAFTVRNKSFPRAIAIKKATKDDLVTEVSYKADFMALHAKGGVRKPEKADVALSVPIEKDAPGFRSASGKVKSRNKVPLLLQYAKANPKKSKEKLKSGVKRPFILDLGTKALVLKRAKDTTTKKSRKEGNGDKFLFSFAKEAKIEKRWDFDKIVKETAEKELPKLFEKRFKEAMATKK